MTFAQSPSKRAISWTDPNAKGLFDLIMSFSKFPEHFAETSLTASTLLSLQVHASCLHLSPWLDCKLPSSRGNV